MTAGMRRFAGQDQRVIDLLLADKYRYLEPEELPVNDVMVAFDELEERGRVDPDEMQQYLQQSNGDFDDSAVYQGEYELEVAARMRQLQQRFPGVPMAEILRMAI